MPGTSETAPAQAEAETELPAAASQLYAWARPKAAVVKVVLQMAIGVVLAILLILRCVSYVWPDFTLAPTDRPLGIVGFGLMLSAGVELAYMLFTAGPDEAVEPLILGLASAALLIANRESFGVSDALSVGILCVAMGGLFWIRERFLDDDEAKPKAAKRLAAKPGLKSDAG